MSNQHESVEVTVTTMPALNLSRCIGRFLDCSGYDVGP